MAKKRVLITGLAGFTGRYVAQTLEHEYEIYGLGATASQEQNYFQADLSDIDALTKVIDQVKPNAIVHLAAVAYVGHLNNNDFYLSNLIGTRNLLQACHSAHPAVETILIASSANVYGNQTAGILSETCPTNPANDYAVSKLAMEQMASLWFDKLPIIITRPFNYTGIGQSEQFLIPKIVRHFKSKSPSIELGNIDVWREFNDVRNVANVYHALLNVKPHGKTFNVCTGQLHSIREIIETAEQLTGHPIKMQVNTAFVRENEVLRLCGDTNKLNQILPNDFTLIPFKETLNWMLNITIND